eukprot:6212089-Pleurochrysis_carterae.AAC.1
MLARLQHSAFCKLRLGSAQPAIDLQILARNPKGSSALQRTHERVDRLQGAELGTALVHAVLNQSPQVRQVLRTPAYPEVLLDLSEYNGGTYLLELLRGLAELCAARCGAREERQDLATHAFLIWDAADIKERNPERGVVERDSVRDRSRVVGKDTQLQQDLVRSLTKCVSRLVCCTLQTSSLTIWPGHGVQACVGDTREVREQASEGVSECAGLHSHAQRAARRHAHGGTYPNLCVSAHDHLPTCAHQTFPTRRYAERLILERNRFDHLDNRIAERLLAKTWQKARKSWTGRPQEEVKCGGIATSRKTRKNE